MSKADIKARLLLSRFDINRMSGALVPLEFFVAVGGKLAKNIGLEKPTRRMRSQNKTRAPRGRAGQVV